MSLWHQCCPRGGEGCDIYEDEFANLDGWTQTSGTWSISGGAASTTSGSALLTCDTDHPDDIASHIVRVNFKATADGDAVRVWLGGSLFVELAVATDGCGTLKLIGSAGTLRETLVEGATLDEWHTLRACYHYGDGTSGKKFFGEFWPHDQGWNDRHPFVLEERDEDSTDATIGLATGTVSGTVYFDNLNFDAYDSDAESPCPTCVSCYIWTKDDQFENAACIITQEYGSWEYVPASPATPCEYGWYTEDADALCYGNVKHSTGYDNSYLKAIVHCSGYGNVCRIYPLYGPGGEFFVETRNSTYSDGTLQPDGYVKVYCGATLVEALVDRQFMLAAPSGETGWMNPIEVEMCVTGNASPPSYALRIGDSGTTVGGAVNFGGTLSEPLACQGDYIAFGTGDMPDACGFGVTWWEWKRTDGDGDETCSPCGAPFCTACPEDRALLPTTWTVEMDGWANGCCDDCAEMNTAHIVTFAAPGSVCEWRTTFKVCTDTYSPGYTYELLLTVSAGETLMLVEVELYEVDDAGGYCSPVSGKWWKYLDPSTNCYEIIEQALDETGSGGVGSASHDCSVSGGVGGNITCMVSANP